MQWRTQHSIKDRQRHAYHSGYCFKIKARQSDNVSKLEYGTEWSILWIIKAFFDIGRINPLDQITPENMIQF